MSVYVIIRKHALYHSVNFKLWVGNIPGVMYTFKVQSVTSHINSIYPSVVLFPFTIIISWLTTKWIVIILFETLFVIKCVCVNVHACVCVYIYVYYVCIHNCIYIHTHTKALTPPKPTTQTQNNQQKRYNTYMCNNNTIIKNGCFKQL